MLDRITCSMGNDKHFEMIEQERAAEQSKKQLEQWERERRRVLIQAIEEAAHFASPLELNQFGELWAPRWWHAGELVRTTTSVRVSALKIPPKPEYQVSANLLDLAIKGADYNQFKVELCKALLVLGRDQDGRIWATRRIFACLLEHLHGPDCNDAGRRQIDILRLDPTDRVILNLLLSHPKSRQLTAEIAASLRRGDKANGKNLSRLKRDGYLEHLPRKGYLLSRQGEQAARAISQLSPKSRF